VLYVSIHIQLYLLDENLAAEYENPAKITFICYF